MFASENPRPGNEEETIDFSEMQSIQGGVLPMWTAEGEMVTCTDPRRWQSPGTLYPSPFRF